jgi:hypothetical protein
MASEKKSAYQPFYTSVGYFPDFPALYVKIPSIFDTRTSSKQMEIRSLEQSVISWESRGRVKRRRFLLAAAPVAPHPILLQEIMTCDERESLACTKRDDWRE